MQAPPKVEFIWAVKESVFRFALGPKKSKFPVSMITKGVFSVSIWHSLIGWEWKMWSIILPSLADTITDVLLHDPSYNVLKLQKNIRVVPNFSLFIFTRSKNGAPTMDKKNLNTYFFQTITSPIENRTYQKMF